MTSRKIVPSDSDKRQRWIILGGIVITLTLLFLVSGFFTWSRFNCWDDEVDINSGRVRHTRYLLFYSITSGIAETWLSRAINDSVTPPDWHLVNTSSPGVTYSPHYHYHAAINQIRTLEIVEQSIPFEPAARREIAETLLASWRNKGSSSNADEYVQRVAETAIGLYHDERTVVTASEIPTR